MSRPSLQAQQTRKIRTQPGFIAALDQSGGSTPKALAAYGVPATAFKDDEEMFALVHQMRTRIMTSPAFNGDRILAAILFEGDVAGSVRRRLAGVLAWPAAYLDLAARTAASVRRIPARRSSRDPVGAAPSARPEIRSMARYVLPSGCSNCANCAA